MAKRRYDAEEEIYYFIRLYAAVGLVCHRWSEENGLEGGADEFDPVKSHPPLLETLLNGTRGQKLPYLWQDEHGVLFAGIQAYGACYLLGPAVAGPLDVVTLHRYYFDYGMKRGMEKQIPVLRDREGEKGTVFSAGGGECTAAPHLSRGKRAPRCHPGRTGRCRSEDGHGARRGSGAAVGQ